MENPDNNPDKLSGFALLGGLPRIFRDTYRQNGGIGSLSRPFSPYLADLSGFHRFSAIEMPIPPKWRNSVFILSLPFGMFDRSTDK